MPSPPGICTLHPSALASKNAHWVTRDPGPAGIRRLAPLTALASLQLEGCHKVGGRTLTALGALTHLDLSHVLPPFQDPDLSGLTALGALRSLRAVSAFCLVQGGALTTPAALPPMRLRHTGRKAVREIRLWWLSTSSCSPVPPELMRFTREPIPRLQTCRQRSTRVWRLGPRHNASSTCCCCCWWWFCNTSC